MKKFSRLKLGLALLAIAAGLFGLRQLLALARDAEEQARVRAIVQAEVDRRAKVASARDDALALAKAHRWEEAVVACGHWSELAPNDPEMKACTQPLHVRENLAEAQREFSRQDFLRARAALDSETCWSVRNAEDLEAKDWHFLIQAGIAAERRGMGGASHRFFELANCLVPVEKKDQIAGFADSSSGILHEAIAQFQAGQPAAGRIQLERLSPEERADPANAQLLAQAEQLQEQAVKLCRGIVHGTTAISVEKAIELFEAWPTLPKQPQLACREEMMAAAVSLVGMGPELGDAHAPLVAKASLALLDDHSVLSEDPRITVGGAARSVLESISQLRAGGAEDCRWIAPGEACRQVKPFAHWPSTWPTWWAWAKTAPHAQWVTRAKTEVVNAAHDTRLSAEERWLWLDSWLELDPEAAHDSAVPFACGPPGLGERYCAWAQASRKVIEVTYTLPWWERKKYATICIIKGVER